MAVRINKAKNFRNKAYVAVDELDNLMKSVTFANTGDVISHAGSNADNDWVLNFTTAENGTANTSSVDLTKIKDYIDNKSITVTGWNGISINSTNPLDPKISADLDGTTLVFSGETDGSKQIHCALKIVKKSEANAGYAASYQLVDNAGTAITGSDDINIVKDILLKSGALVYGTAEGLTAQGGITGESSTKTTTAIYPFIKLVLHTNSDGDLTNDSATETTIYIPVNELFHDKTAGWGIDATALASNEIKVVADGTNVIYTAANTSAPILTVTATGVTPANIQGAINYAVNDEHAKASSAITSLNTNVTNLANATSTAVDTLNGRIDTVATNAQTAIQAIGTAVDTLDTQVSAAISATNTNVETAIDTVVSNVNTALGTNITAVNNAVSAAVHSTNTKVNTAVTSVNTQVTALKNVTSTAVTTLNTNVSSFKDTVSATIYSNNTALDTVVTNVNTNVSAVITNVNTVLKPNTSTCAVTLVEETVTPGPKSGEAGVYETTVTAKYVLNVFSENGDEIYPDIVRGSTLTDGKYTFTLTADYGAAQSTVEKWKVICANDVASATIPTDVAAPATVNTVAYSDVTNNVAYTNAGSGNDATYGDVTKTDATFVNATDTTWTTVTDVAGKTVGSGDAATAPTAPDAVSEAALSYSGH